MRSAWEDSEQSTEPIWRYFKTNRFIDFLSSTEIYFASATQFEDRFEGCVAIQSPEYKTDPRYEDYEFGEKSFSELRRLTKISCWHRAAFESDAMWKLYANLHKGVAIQTTTQLLPNAIKPYQIQPKFQQEQLWGGEIRYMDLTKERLPNSLLNRFFYKHRAFAWEQEYRLAISLREAEECGVRVPDLGIKVATNPSQFIERIILGPYLDDSERSLIESAVREAGMADRTEVSTLVFKPRYI